MVVAPLNETLCVLLSKNASVYGEPVGGVTKCKRDGSNRIVYQGGWCSTTNAAATASCSDAEEVSATFAASSVKILN